MTDNDKQAVCDAGTAVLECWLNHFAPLFARGVSSASRDGEGVVRIKLLDKWCDIEPCGSSWYAVRYSDGGGSPWHGRTETLRAVAEWLVSEAAQVCGEDLERAE